MVDTDSMAADMNEAGEDVPIHRGPLMLFDGVCNLCSAVVQWVIERDPDGRIRFASLQSEAGAKAVRDAGADLAQMPDSFVLVDAQGVRTRSAAAIGVAGHLGFPYSLVSVGLVLPRPVRDALYEFIARNRYRWFGRRDTCMLPAPDLAARFLDAAEPRELVTPVSIPAAPPGNAWLGAWLPRFAIAYVVAYAAPFPLTLLGYLGFIPGVGAVAGWLIGLHGAVVNPLAHWVGSAFFGVDASLAFTGSGDQTFHYLDLLVDAVLALAGSVAWTAMVRARSLSLRTLDASQVLARFYLGTTLLGYGWAKLFPLQFSVPGPDRLLQPYGDSSPMGLAWTFLGASVGYQMFAGLSELIGGYLLFWRRTALLGALVSTAVMLNVVAINVFFDVPVKIFSAHLVLIALFIIAPEMPRLGGMLLFNLPIAASGRSPFWSGSRRRTGAVVALHLLFVGGLTFFQIASGYSASLTRGVLAEPAPLTGIYRVESFVQGGLEDRDNPDTARWVRVGLNLPGIATIQRASGDAVRMRTAFDADAATLSFFERGGQPPETPMFTFTEPVDDVLRLEGEFEGKATLVVMRKDEHAALLTERGFRWINEFPFNR